MKIEIEKSKLEKIISDMQPFLEKRDNSQITSHILIETNQNEVIFKATDYEIGITSKIKTENIQDNEKITINGKDFLNILKNLKDDKITITNNNEKLEIKQEKTKITLPSFIAENFPEFPSNYQHSKINNINSKNILESLKKILPVIEPNNSKIEIRNALIDIKDGRVNFVATDTRRLEIIKFPIQSMEKISFMFPRRSILEIQKFFDGEAEIYLHDNNIIIENDDYIFWTRIPNGNFLDYERVIPKDSQIKFKIHINKDKMAESLKVINSISKKVKITFDKTKITFESISDGDSKAVTEINIDTELNKDFIALLDENLEICMTSQYILEYIKHINTANFEFGINENRNSACILRSSHDSIDFILIAIPVLI